MTDPINDTSRGIQCRVSASIIFDPLDGGDSYFYGDYILPYRNGEIVTVYLDEDNETIERIVRDEEIPY